MPLRPRIIVGLPKNRDLPGVLRIENKYGHTVFGPIPALGRAGSNVAKDWSKKHPKDPVENPARSPLVRFGDTPYGTYSVSVLTYEQKIMDPSKYGPNGVIVLTPTGGEALLAAQMGRTGIWIHGGRAGKPSPFQGLVATGGCVRCLDKHMKRLLKKLEELMIFDGPPESCSIAPSIEASLIPVEFSVDVTTIGNDPPENPRDAAYRTPPDGYNSRYKGSRPERPTGPPKQVPPIDEPGAQSKPGRHVSSTPSERPADGEYKTARPATTTTPPTTTPPTTTPPTTTKPHGKPAVGKKTIPIKIHKPN